MQAPEKPNSSDDSDKSLSEWPTLDDVSNNTKKSTNGRGFIKKRNGEECNKSPPENQNGNDDSKENENPSPGPSAYGAKKKNANKTKWVSVPIPHQPYKKRGNGRQFYDSNRNNGEKKNESLENGNTYDGGRHFARGNNRSRGKRGRGHYNNNFRQRREESDPPASGCDKLKPEHGYYSNPAFYDPFVYQVYLSPALRAENDLKEAIRKQIEYYFSDENLVSDKYLRRNMDSQGYVSISLIATFNRMKRLTSNLNRIVEALIDSSKLELLDNAKVRPVVDPLKWPIKESSGLRTDVPEFFPGQPYLNTIVNGMHNLSFTNDESLPQSPEDSLSPDQVCDYFYEPNVNDIYCPLSPDCYSHSPSPLENVNGFDYFAEQISNGVSYCLPNGNAGQMISNGINYNSSPEDNLTSDNSDDILGNKSPEPPQP